MHTRSQPSRRAARALLDRGLRAAAIASLALLAGGAALAASTIVPSSFATKTGTVWQFIVDNASRSQGATCYKTGTRPSETFNCLKAVLTATGLDETLQGRGPVTLFAPTDAGFAALQRLMGPGPFQGLMSDRHELTVLLHHMMVEGRYTSADLQGKAVPATGRLTLKTLAGTELEITFDRFPSAAGRVKVGLGSSWQPGWQPYLVGQSTLLDNGAVIPIDMVYVPSELR